MDNLLLCRRHHRLVHEGGYGIELRTGNEIRFTDPAGKHLPDTGQGRSRGNVLALMTDNAEFGVASRPIITAPRKHSHIGPAIRRDATYREYRARSHY